MADEIPGRTQPTSVAKETRFRLRVRTDLETKGVPPDLARSTAERLAPVVARLSTDEYAAAVEAAAVAAAAGRVDGEARRQTTREIEEIQRLMQDFAGELRKLEEGLRILSAYAVRMRSRSDREASGTLH